MNSTTARPRGSRVPLRCLRKMMFLGAGTGGGTGEMGGMAESFEGIILGEGLSSGLFLPSVASFSELEESLIAD